MIASIKEAIKKLEHKNEILTKHIPNYERDFVIPAKKHAHKLLTQARDFNKLVKSIKILNL